jgi:hypothetical protein
MSPERRFWSRIGGSGDPDECWVWTGCLHVGYGRLTVNGVRWLAHRWSYTQLRADIPEGLQIDHLCRNRACVNPWHLEPVSCQENLRRAPHNMKTTCPQGHELSGHNLNVRARSNGQGFFRSCRKCDCARTARARARNALKALGVPA